MTLFDIVQGERSYVRRGRKSSIIYGIIGIIDENTGMEINLEN